MRSVFAGIILVALVRLGHAQEPSSLDATVREFHLPFTLGSCGIASVFEQLSRQTMALAGLERGPDCLNSVSFPHLQFNAPSYDLSGLTVRDVLDRLVLVAPSYSWRERNGRAVVRPVMAWDDPHDVFNGRLNAFHVTGGSIRSVVSLIFGVQPPSGTPPSFDFDFPGGTLIDALNTIAESCQRAVWYAGLLENGPHNIGPSVTVSVLSSRCGGGFSLATPLPIPTGR